MTQTIQTFDTNELSLPTTDPQVTQLNLTISTSLMTNYEPSRAVDSQNAIDVAEDVNGNPMVFSIGTATELYAIFRTSDPQAPWSQTDLTSGLGSGWQVETFCLLQTPQQSIYLALGIKDSAGQSHFYVTGALSNNPQDPAWTGDFTSNWVERAFSEGFSSIDHIIMSSAASAGSPPVIVATATLPTGEAQRYYVNADVTTQLNLWQAWPVPQNASSVIDVAVGAMPIGSLVFTGSFVLYTVGSTTTTTQLDFTFMMNGQYISRPLTPPSGAMALATLQNADGTTDLYVAGDGIYVFTSSNMGNSAGAQQIGGTIDAGTGTEMIVRQDSANIVVWVIDEGLLYYLHGAKGATVTWTAPLPVQGNVGQIAALRNTVLDTNELFLVTADEQLSYLYQDPASSLWKEILIPLADVGSALPYQCYTTQITLRDQNNNPVARNFSIGATQWTYLTVNGSACIVDQNTMQSIASDPTGSLTVISKVSTLSTPTLNLSSSFLSVVVDINPQSVVNNNLKLFTTDSALAGATDQNGQPVISGTSQIPVATAATALQQLTTLHDSTGSSSTSGVTTRAPGATPSNVINVAALPAGFGFAISGIGSNAAAYHDSQAAAMALPELHAHGARAAAILQPHRALVTSSAGSDVVAFFGDVMETIENGLDQIGNLVVQVVNGVVTFSINLGSQLVSVIVDTVEKVMHLIGWVLQELEIALDKVIAWLGFLFNWNDILTAHSIIVNSVNMSFAYAQSQLVNAESIVGNFFTNLKSQYDGLTAPTGPNATASVLSQSQNPAPGFPNANTNYFKSPGGNFANYHLQHSGILNATPPVTPASGNPIVDMFTQVIEPLGKDLGETVETIALAMRDDFVSGTLTPTTAFAQIKTDAVNGALTAAQNASTGALKVADDLVTSIQGLVCNQWNIPFLTPLYALITNGSALTLVDAIALLIAIPGVPMYKLISGNSPFANGTYGLDNTTTAPADYFSALSGQSTAVSSQSRAASATASATAAAPETTSTPPGAILYSQIGGCVYCVAELVAMTLDAILTEVEEEPPSVNYIFLACEAVMQAASYPVGSGSAVAVLRILWWIYLVALLRIVALILGAPAGAIGVFELAFALIKFICFLSAILIQTMNDSGTELALEWETFFGNLVDAIERAVSGSAKLDPDKEISGLGLDVIAVWLSVVAIFFDGMRLGIVIADDEAREFHAF